MSYSLRSSNPSSAAPYPVDPTRPHVWSRGARNPIEQASHEAPIRADEVAETDEDETGAKRSVTHQNIGLQVRGEPRTRPALVAANRRDYTLEFHPHRLPDVAGQRTAPFA